jgi:hypothetical protein
MAVREAQPLGRCCVRLAALRPYSEGSERRPVALRPTLSGGLPFSGFELLGLKRSLSGFPYSRKCAIQQRDGKKPWKPAVECGENRLRGEGADVFHGEVRREEFIPVGKELLERTAVPGLDHCFEGRSRGLTNWLVAERLDIAEASVRHHLTSIFAKLKVFAIVRLSTSSPEVPAPRVAVRGVVLGVELQCDGTWTVVINFTCR